MFETYKNIIILTSSNVRKSRSCVLPVLLIYNYEWIYRIIIMVFSLFFFTFHQSISLLIINTWFLSLLPLTLTEGVTKILMHWTLLNRSITTQWEVMGDVGSASVPVSVDTICLVMSMTIMWFKATVTVRDPLTPAVGPSSIKCL